MNNKTSINSILKQELAKIKPSESEIKEINNKTKIIIEDINKNQIE